MAFVNLDVTGRVGSGRESPTGRVVGADRTSQHCAPGLQPVTRNCSLGERDGLDKSWTIRSEISKPISHVLRCISL